MDLPVRLLVARTEAELRGWDVEGDAVIWLGPRPAPAALGSRAVQLPDDPTALEGWLEIRRLGDCLIGGRSVKQALTYRGVSLWWFVHYWLVYGFGVTGWDGRYRTLKRLLAGEALGAAEVVLLSGRADDDLVARTFAAHKGLPYRWAIPPWSRLGRRIALRWGGELLFRIRLGKLIVRGFLARALRRNTVAGRGKVDLLFNTTSSTWDAALGTDRVLSPLIDEAAGGGLTVVGLHLDHRRNLGLDTLRRLDRRIIAWEALSPRPSPCERFWPGGGSLVRLGGMFPGEVHGVPAAMLLSDRLPVLFSTRLADSIIAIETCREIISRLMPTCVYIVDAYDLWGRALVVAARDCGVRSIEIQHGIIEQSHDGYLHLEGEVSPNRDQRSPYSPIPDLITVHGDAPRGALITYGRYPSDAVLVTGSPQIEAIRRHYASQDGAREALGFSGQGLYVLFFGAPFHVFPADDDHLRAFLSCCRGMPDLKPLLRPHPAEEKGERYHQTARAFDIDAPVLTRADPFELIVAADVVIAHNSTTALDAMVLQRPVIHINMSGSPDLFSFVDDAGAVPARTEDELRHALIALRDPVRRRELVGRHEPYAAQYYARRDNPARAILLAGFANLVRP